MTSDDGLMGFVVILCGRNLVENGDHENCGLAHAGLGLAQNVIALERKWDGLNLNFTRMFESTLSNGPLELILKEELIPSGQVGTLILLILILLRLLLIRALILRHNISHVSFPSISIISIIQLER